MTAPVVELSSLLVSKAGYRQGRPCLRGTGITVHTIAAGLLRGDTAEEVCLDFADLDPSLIHAGIAYYYANRERIEREIEQDDAEGERLRLEHPDGIPPHAAPPAS